MTRRFKYPIVFIVLGSLSCDSGVAPSLPVETEYSFVNLSQRWYATIALRSSAGGDREYTDFSPLIPPGGILRERFLEALPATGGCPDRLDLQIYLYKRIGDDIPVGLDLAEEVDLDPVASEEILDVVACEQVVASTYTIVMLDTLEGEGTLRFVQATSAEQIRFFSGNALIALDQPPPILDSAPLEGRLLLANECPLPTIGVLLRRRYRVTSDDSELCPDEPVGFCYSEPIAIDATDADGRFSFDRPPGAYMVEVFADNFAFRPVFVEVESPIDNIIIVAEPRCETDADCDDGNSCTEDTCNTESDECLYVCVEATPCDGCCDTVCPNQCGGI